MNKIKIENKLVNNLITTIMLKTLCKTHNIFIIPFMYHKIKRKVHYETIWHNIDGYEEGITETCVDELEYIICKYCGRVEKYDKDKDTFEKSKKTITEINREIKEKKYFID